MALNRVLSLAALGLMACSGGDGEETPDAPERCLSWTDATLPATGTFVASTSEGVVDGTWKIGVEASNELMIIRTCIFHEFDRNDPEERWIFWERWTSLSFWRLPEPISQKTKIDGATLTGTPGMSGGLQLFHLDEEPCKATRDCRPINEKPRFFQSNGASDLFVDVWDPFSRSFQASGWVLTDDTGEQIDLDIQLTW